MKSFSIQGLAHHRLFATLVTASAFLIGITTAHAQWNAKGRVPVTSTQVDIPVREPVFTADASGRLVVASTPTDPSQAGLYVEIRRLDTNGMADESFGISGVATIVLPDSLANLRLVSIVDFKSSTLILGQATLALSPDSLRMIVLKVNAQGLRDANFGAQGVVISDKPAQDTSLPAKFIIEENSDQLIISSNAISGTKVTKITDQGTFLAYTPSYPLPAQQGFIFPLSGDRTVIAYVYESDLGRRFHIARYTASGALDQTFGNNGVYEWNAASGAEIVTMPRAVATADGVVTIMTLQQGMTSSEMAVWRFPSDFGAASTPASYHQTSNDVPLPTMLALASDSSNHTYMGGFAFTNQGTRTVVNRLRQSMELDESFADAGTWYPEPATMGLPSAIHNFSVTPVGGVYALISVAVNNVAHYFIQQINERTTDVHESIEQKNGVNWSVSRQNGYLSIDNLPAGEVWGVFDVIGNQYAAGTASGNGRDEVGTVGAGIVLIRTVHSGTRVVMVP